jgi:hypothetical protein
LAAGTQFGGIIVAKFRQKWLIRRQFAEELRDRIALFAVEIGAGREPVTSC